MASPADLLHLRFCVNLFCQIVILNRQKRKTDIKYYLNASRKILKWGTFNNNIKYHPPYKIGMTEIRNWKNEINTDYEKQNNNKFWIQQLTIWIRCRNLNQDCFQLPRYLKIHIFRKHFFFAADIKEVKVWSFKSQTFKKQIPKCQQITHQKSKMDGWRNYGSHKKWNLKCHENWRKRWVGPRADQQRHMVVRNRVRNIKMYLRFF